MKRLFSFVSVLAVAQLISITNCLSASAAFVVTGGAVLKNQTNTPAEDARIGFRIPSLFGGEEILGGNIKLRTAAATLDQIVQIGNTGLSRFDEDIIFTDGVGSVAIPPNELVFIDIVFDSKKSNAVKWLKNVYLTDAQGKELPTQTGLAGFVVERKPNPSQNSPNNFNLLNEPQLSYTFTNDGNTELFIESITLGKSLDFIEPVEFSPDMLINPSFFNNGGIGWMLLPDEEIALDVPFDLEGGSFLVADIVGTALPGSADAFPVRFTQEHEEPIPVPEPLNILGASAALGFGGFFKRKVSQQKNKKKA